MRLHHSVAETSITLGLQKPINPKPCFSIGSSTVLQRKANIPYARPTPPMGLSKSEVDHLAGNRPF